LPTIESALEKAIAQVLNEKPKLQAASRTDAGVHAQGQIVNFFSETKLPLEGIKMRLNRALPACIAILEIRQAPLTFHPTLDCALKEYHYFVCNTHVQMPEHRLTSWHFPYALDFDLMEQAIPILTGNLNFQAFCNVRKNHTYADYTREVTAIEIVKLGKNRLCFKIKGNKFLYKMVRNLVGTLLYVGCGKITLRALENGLASKKRTQIGVTAKAHGLTLAHITYTECD